MERKPKKEKRKSFLSVQAVYPGGIMEELDDLLIEVAGRGSDGSGCSLIGKRERDHSWYFDLDQRTEAEKLAARLGELPVNVDLKQIPA